MEGSREAEMIVTFALEGINYACRLSGAFAKNIAAMIAAVAKTPGNSPGKTRMKQLMQSGEPLDYYVVPEAKMKEFAQLAKKYGIQYCVAMNQDGAYDLVVKKSDSPRINRIAEHLGIGQVQGGINMDVNDEEKANATNITPEQELMQDMMSPNKNEREHDEVNFGQELSEEEPAFGSSSTSFNQRESVMDQVNNYQQAQESARDMFAGARSLREASMSDLPDGAEPIVVDIGWTLRLEIAVGPHVVVAGEEVDFHPPVGQLRQGAEQPGETFRDDAPVFVPEIEQISYEEDGFGIGGNPPQPSDEQFFAFPRLLRR